MRRHDLLGHLHDLLQPRSYFEVGVNVGQSLTLSRTRSIGVDPFFTVREELRCDLHLVRATSDEFFARPNPMEHLTVPTVDLAFIDGMHLSEYALRDFMNTERYTHAASVVVIDDMLPRNVGEASRARSAYKASGAWAGDVYKVADALRQHRPDLVVLEVDTAPTGTVVVLLPDPTSRALDEAYDDLVESFVVPDPQPVPQRVMDRTHAVDPDELVAAPFWGELRRLRELPDAEARAEMTGLLKEAGLATAVV